MFGFWNQFETFSIIEGISQMKIIYLQKFRRFETFRDSYRPGIVKK